MCSILQKKDIEKNGIILKGPFIASNYVYSIMRKLGRGSSGSLDSYEYNYTIIKSCYVIPGSKKTWKQWGVRPVGPYINPYAEIHAGVSVNGRSYYATDYIPVFEVEIEY